MNDQLYGHSLSQEDDISILPGEDDVSSINPHVIPFFNLTASRHQLPSTSGISSMEALRNAYEELKKKYNDLNFKYQTLYAFARKNHRAEFLPDELPSGSHSLDEKNKILEMSRKDEIEKLHSAILRLNLELSEEKEKNIKLSVQINSYKEKSLPTCVEGPNEKSLSVLEDLRKNVEKLEKSVEVHKVIISKQLPHSKLGTTQSLFGKSDFISQRKQQSEHDELSSLGNKSVHSPIKVLSSAAAASKEQLQKTPWLQHQPEELKTRPSIVDLKSTRLKQDKQPDKTLTTTSTTTHISPSHLHTNVPSSSSSSSSSQSSSTTTTTNSDTNALHAREKDLPCLNNAEALPTGEDSLCVSEMLCPICEKPFTDLSKFQEHVFDCKSDPLDRSCPVCLKNFKNASQEIFEEHVHTHFDQPDGRPLPI